MLLFLCCLFGWHTEYCFWCYAWLLCVCIGLFILVYNRGCTGVITVLEWLLKKLFNILHERKSSMQHEKYVYHWCKKWRNSNTLKGLRKTWSSVCLGCQSEVSVQFALFHCMKRLPGERFVLVFLLVQNRFWMYIFRWKSHRK